MDIQDPIKTTVDELLKVLNIENVVGEVIETEDKVLIPITKMGMAFGAGMGEGKGPDSQGGTGAGAGGAAGIEPIAMIAVFKGVAGPEGVKLISLTPPNQLAQALGEMGSAMAGMMKEGGMKKKWMKKHKKDWMKKQEESKPESEEKTE
jgi:uncharacterized spore protein YtfJ